MRTVSTQEARDLQKDDVPLINVLPIEEYQKRHIPDSVNIPIAAEDFERQVEDVVGGRDRTVAVYCASTECDASDAAAKRLEEAGFADVVDYEGGTKAWEDAGFELDGRAA